MYLVVTIEVEVAVMVAGAVDAAVFSPRVKPVVTPVLAAATQHTHTQIIQITERKIAMIPLLIAVLWPQLFVQHALLSRA